jgi:chloride channel 3/4/5
MSAGAAIGMNAAFLNIITEWLSDIKLGYCKTAFYLNESFCCWGEDNGMEMGDEDLSYC